jgi:hypothetical protein
MVIHIWVREMDTGVWFRYLKETDCFESRGIDGKVLKWSMEGIDWG